MRAYEVTIFFNDNTQVVIECDDFIRDDGGFFNAQKDGYNIMTFPFQSVKYISVKINKEVMKDEQVDRF